LRAPLTEVDLPEVCRELGLLVPAARHVRVRLDDLAPRLERPRDLALDRRRILPPFVPRLLLEAHPEQLHPRFLQVLDLGRGDRREEADRRVDRAVRVIRRERALVRPAVPHVAQLADQRPLRVAERPPEDVVPRLPHQAEQRRHVPLGEREVQVQPVVLDEAPRLLAGAIAVHIPELTFHERREAVPQQIERATDAVAVGYCHGLPSSFFSLSGVAAATDALRPRTAVPDRGASAYTCIGSALPC